MIKKIAIVGIIILFTLLFIYCTTDESTIIGPFGNAGKYISVTNFSADKTRLYSNGDTTLISIKVLDVDKTPAIGLKVDFSAQFGSITESDTTDSSGVAFATFISDGNTGENIITADTGVKTYTLPITVVKYQPTYLVLSAESPVILADGESKTKITAVLKDSTGSPMEGMTVSFHTTLGDLSSPIEITDENGTVYSELTSSDTIGTATVTATSGIESSINVKFHMDVPAIIELSAGNPVLLADGISSTIITVVVKDSIGHRMDNESVKFSTTNGTFVGASDSKIEITEQGGTAQVELISSTTPGTALIIASSFVSDSVEVEFRQYVPFDIDITSETYTLLADGISKTEITAVPRDDQGRKMPNIPVYFSTTNGTLSSSIVNTEAGGVAKTILTSTTTEGVAEVTVTSYVIRSINIKFQKYVAAYLNLSAESPVVLADGESSTILTAVVRDSTGRRMEGETVRFSTNLGELDKVVEVTDREGIATAALFSSTPGTALIIATSFVSDSVEVEFKNNVPDRIDIFATPSVILADGQSISTITAIPKDKDGNPMPGLSVSFSTTLGTLKETLVITDAEGKAETDLISETTDGIAYVTATSSAEGTVGVQFIAYNPTYIKLSTDTDENSILADGISKLDVIAEVYNSANQKIPWAIVDFSTDAGYLDKTTGVRANQEGKAIVTLRSAGVQNADLYVVVTAEVQGLGITETVLVTFRGISMTTYVDSLQFSTGGYYNAFIRTELIESTNGRVIEEAAVRFNSTIGIMEPEIDGTNEFGRTFSILYADVTGADQSDLVITTELSNAPEISKQTDSYVIPGVEALISTVDDEVMGDGEGWALVKATLRETTGNKAITEIGIDWKTTLGTIKGLSETNTTGHTIDTLRIENSVSTNTDVTITANFGDHISISDILTFIPPVNSNRLIMGFEPDTTTKDSVPCDIEPEFATRDAGISALYVNANSNPIGGQTIDFSITPNYFAAICPATVTVDSLNGRALVMMAYPPQYIGEIVRVWAAAPDGTRGSIDVILPAHKEEEESGGG